MSQRVLRVPALTYDYVYDTRHHVLRVPFGVSLVLQGQY